MRNVMVDLETVGNRAGCGILSIGAVAFCCETGKLGPEFYTVVRLSTCEAVGLRSDQDTLDWWAKQPPDARKIFAESRKQYGNASLTEALIKFNTFLAQFGGPKIVKVWGNGPDFDNAILYACYAAVCVEAGWEFWNSRCFRTLKDLGPVMKMERVGTHHNALDDAKTQALHATKILTYMKSNCVVRFVTWMQNYLRGLRAK